MEFKKKLPQVMSDNVDPGLAAPIKLELQRFNKIYFHSKMNTELTLSGDIQKIYLFLIIAALVLLIASMGIFGLTSFMIEQRFKVNRIRKVLGISSSQLVFALTNNFLKWGFCFKSNCHFISFFHYAETVKQFFL